jgi:hypothetical protein
MWPKALVQKEKKDYFKIVFFSQTFPIFVRFRKSELHENGFKGTVSRDGG